MEKSELNSRDYSEYNDPVSSFSFTRLRTGPGRLYDPRPEKINGFVTSGYLVTKNEH